jgi:hypothetical protein
MKYIISATVTLLICLSIYLFCSFCIIQMENELENEIRRVIE